MDNKPLYKFCKELGCCDVCCFRFMGYKKPSVYIDVKKCAEKYLDGEQNDALNCRNSLDESNLEDKLNEVSNNMTAEDMQTDIQINESEGCVKEYSVQNKRNSVTYNCKESPILPPCKKRKVDVCVSCLGVLQEDYWEDTISSIKEIFQKKRYECETYTCGLSAPISTILRESIIALKIKDTFPDYDPNTITPLKDAWKMTFRERVAVNIDKMFNMDSPLLITVHLDYPDDLQELEILKRVSSDLFKSRSKQKRRFPTEFTRQSVEQALENATLATLSACGASLEAHEHAQCVSVVCAHAPAYLAGRYIKLSRNLPQSPWVLDGRRVLPTSVQEIIFGPLAKLFNFSETEVESRLKFIAAGREDVDVRCLGEGRPFAIEISDPLRQLKLEELQLACEEVSKSGDVVVKSLTYVSRDDLAQLKKGEETKCKTYEALCVKLTHSKFDDDATGAVKITEKDINFINTYRNTELTDCARVNITQKTPIRVLHRRPLLNRSRQVLELSARPVPEHPHLFLLHIVTSAGTYVKEWIHGELARSRPSLSHLLAADIDLLALDVTKVHLDWPPTRCE
ncbi:putative tRNA pseudouridine synthase Pus10 [Zerene cesonia]|uniref:putative tRNA pseudouridine synthase Pus10 n=1 Tax=Zerene cesonia TaxID=33412 RepID=UPI0018E4FA9C|nr:putative tRNA pseudouridine synthase Pus10 [Zerene cesonia]